MTIEKQLEQALIIAAHYQRLSAISYAMAREHAAMCAHLPQQKHTTSWQYQAMETAALARTWSQEALEIKHYAEAD